MGPEGEGLPGNRNPRTQPIHELASIDDNYEAPTRGGNDLLAQQCSAQSFDQIECAAFHFVRAVDGEIDLPMFRKGRERDTRSRRLCRGSFRGRDSEKSQALPMASSESLDRE